jgi:Protein of unknown function (DUF3551)
MRSMHLALVAAMAAIAASASPAVAQQGAGNQWCAQFEDGATNCGFTTLSQCNAAISGNGGFCDRNNMAAAIAAPAPATTGSVQRRRTTVGAGA